MAKKKESNRIALQDSLTIENAATLKKQILKSLNSYNTTLLDLTEVTDIDISIVQIILSAKEEAAINNKKFFITGIVCENIRTLFATLTLTLPENTIEVLDV